MFLIFLALVLGYLTARLMIFPQSWRKPIQKIGILALFLLLFFMGISLGADAQIISSLPTVGLKAIFISLGTILGSIACVWLVTKLGSMDL